MRYSSKSTDEELPILAGQAEQESTDIVAPASLVDLNGEPNETAE